MSTNAIAVLGAVFSAWFGNPVSVRQDQTWSCKDLVWTTPVTSERGGRTWAEITTECEFKGSGGGGYSQLETYLLSKFKNGAEIHSGPTAGTFDTMPSTSYDVTTPLKFDSQTVTVRSDSLVATDRAKALSFSSVSKEINATGTAGYLTKYDLIFRVASTLVQGSYKVVPVIKVELQKPNLIPGGMFRSKVRQAIEGSATQFEGQIIEDIQGHI